MFYRTAYFSQDWEGVAMCDTLMDCFFVTTHQGLLFSGINGEWLEKENHTVDKGKYLGRFFFEVSFFVIIVIIFLNVVFGIIIDTFAAMRNATQEKLDDMRNRCFICGLDRYLIDRNSEIGFDAHIVTEHNMWGYMYYMVYVQRKESTEYTGIESYVAEHIEEESPTWFPLHKALCLQKSDDNDIGPEQQMLDQMAELRGEVAVFQKELKSVSSQQKETTKNVDSIMEGVRECQEELGRLRTQQSLE